MEHNPNSRTGEKDFVHQNVSGAQSPQKKPEIRTGVIRSDIQFIPPGEHGDYAMIYDPLSEAYYKLSERSCRILQLMDRSYEFGEFLERVNSFGLDAEKEELLELIHFLHMNNLIVPEYGVLDAKVRRHREMKEKNTFYRIMGMYLFFRLPPIHPDGFFTATMPFIRFVFNNFTLFFINDTAVGGYILLLRSWNEAYATFVNSLSWAGLVKYFWALLVTKSVHELAHGYTAKSFGARVRAMGLSFIVFYPRLFVDLTDTWRLSRAKRTVCDGAGIASELIFGGLAAIVWVYASPGPLKSTMFYLFTVSALGTILVNGNPFIRYDGYYLLCDFMNIENLMQRSSEFIKAWNRRFFLHRAHAQAGGIDQQITSGYGLFQCFPVINILDIHTGNVRHCPADLLHRLLPVRIGAAFAVEDGDLCRAVQRRLHGDSRGRAACAEDHDPLPSDFHAVLLQISHKPDPVRIMAGQRAILFHDDRIAGADQFRRRRKPVHQPGRLRLARHRHIKSPSVQRAERFDRIRRPLLRHVKGQIGRVDPPPRETVIVHGGRARMPDRRADQGE